MLQIIIDLDYIWSLSEKDHYNVISSEILFTELLSGRLYKYFGRVGIKFSRVQNYITDPILYAHDLTLLSDSIESVIDSGEWLVQK